MEKPNKKSTNQINQAHQNLSEPNCSGTMTQARKAVNHQRTVDNHSEQDRPSSTFDEHTNATDNNTTVVFNDAEKVQSQR